MLQPSVGGLPEQESQCYKQLSPPGHFKDSLAARSACPSTEFSPSKLQEINIVLKLQVNFIPIRSIITLWVSLLLPLCTDWSTWLKSYFTHV